MLSGSQLNNRLLCAILHLTALIGLLSSRQSLANAEQQSLDSIRAAAKHYAAQSIHLNSGEEMEIVVGRLDNRLRLPACQGPLESSNPQGQSSRTLSLVEVRCQTGKNWRVYVSVNVTILTPVVVSKHPIMRGAFIQAADLQIVKMDRNKLSRGYFTRPKALLNKVARRYIPADTAIIPGNLKQMALIERGQTVLIKAANSHLSVMAKGTAMDNGHFGDWIKVKNRSSERIIDAKVIESGKVEVVL